MDYNTIRAFILLVFGLVLIRFPDEIYRFQTLLFKKFYAKYNAGTEGNRNALFGVILIISAILLFVYSIVS